MIKKLNNKGLTVVEILVCFSIVVVIVMSMFKVVNNQKAKQEIESTKNSMLTYKNEVTKTIEEDIINIGGVSSAEYSTEDNGDDDENVYVITYPLKDTSTRKLKIHQNNRCDENSKDDKNNAEAKDVESEGDDGVIDCHKKNFIEFYKGDKIEDKFEIPDIYTLRFNDVQITNNNDYLKVYVGFRHNDLGNKYSALDIVIPINKEWY